MSSVCKGTTLSDTMSLQCPVYALLSAVGASGEVVTFEQSPESLKIAKKNVFTWNSTHGLPDNVHFVQDSVANVSAHSCTAPMDSVGMWV